MLFMNTKLRAGWLAVAFFCTASLLSAQKSPVNELISRADRQYDLYSYNLAIQTYMEALELEKSNAHALARIGDCNYQLNRPEKAIEWYQKAQNTFKMEADVPLRLGRALMQTGDYDGAKDQFLLYAETDDKVGRHYAGQADYAIKNAKKESQWQIKNEAINTSAADFGAAFYKNNIAFNSARTDIIPNGKPAADPQGGNTNYLFVSQRNPESELLQKPTFLRSDIQNTRNEGPVSFASNGKRVAFCRNRFISGTRQIAETGMNMSLYLADVEDGNWTNVKAFTHNGSNFATGFPALSPDGKKLIFASTQPGGYGGWDIYVSNWTANGWSEPRNLGTPLNTPGDEVTPFFDGEDLYFSSDWHNGFGGLDVFRASLGREEIDEVFNLGPGVNSARDDYGFIFNSNENIGYLTSTRSGGRGNEDIWMASKKWDDDEFADRTGTKSLIKRDQNPRPNEYSTPSDENYASKGRELKAEGRLHILVVDERGLPLSDAELDLSDCYGAKGITGADGKFYFDELLRPIDCNISTSKRGYLDSNIALRDFGKQNIKITLALDNREEFRGYVYDARTRAPIRGVTVQLELPEGVLETSTDEEGYYSLNMEPGQSYLISYNKYGYVDAVVRTSFPFNSNNKILAVNLEKTYVEEPAAVKNTTKRDGYVEYDNTAKPIVYSDNSSTPITKVLPRETPKTPISEKFMGYSIQLAAMPEEPSDARLASYEALTKLGNLYVKSENKLNKIRLGIFPTLAGAEESLKTVLKDKSNKGAFVIEERGADETLIIGTENEAPVHPSPIAKVEKSNNAAVLYAIQVGTHAAGKSISISEYNRLDGLGNLYSKLENGYTKVRVGVWSKYAEAEKAKAEALRRGFTSTTIVSERADDPDISDYLPTPTEPIKPDLKKKDSSAPAPVVYSTTPEASYPYYVRIAALSKPEDFDPYPLEGLGTIEKRKAPNSPGMTIILLGAYPDQESATRIANKLIVMGYEDAYVVKDEKGKLIRK
jgi:cell division septation protein DedD